MRKIDIHAHTTNRKLENIVQTSASLETLQKEMETYEIEKTVVLATYFPHRGSGISNYRLSSWIIDNPEFVMFGSLDFEHYFYQGINELEELSCKKRIAGIKIYAGYQNIDLSSKKFDSVLKLADQYSLPVMFHLGYCHSLRDETGQETVGNLIRPGDLYGVVRENPETDFVVSHLANPFFDELIHLVSFNANVFADMSGLFHSSNEADALDAYVEVIKKYLGECGPKKLLFGTDFPVQTHKHSIELVERSMIDYSEKDKSDVYYDNARRLLK